MMDSLKLHSDKIASHLATCSSGSRKLWICSGLESLSIEVGTKLRYTNHSQHLFSGSAVLTFCFSQGLASISDHPPSLVPRLSPQKRGGGESLVTSAGKVVDFRRLALAVPIRLQNETTCTRDILSTQQKIVDSKMNL